MDEPTTTEESRGPLGRFMRYRALIQGLGFSGLTNLSNLLVVGVMLVAARMLGSDDFGALAYAQSLAIILMMPVNFGLDFLVVRQISRQKDLAPRYLFNHMIWAGGIAVVLMLLLSAATFTIFDMDGRLQLVVILTAATWALRILAMSLQAYFRPFDRYDRESMVALAGQAVYLVMGLGVLVLGLGLVPLVVALLVARLIGFLISLIAAERYIGMSYVSEPGLMFKVQKQAFSIGLSLALISIYLQIDILILEAELSLQDVGVYGAALKVYMALFMLPGIVTSVLLPRLSTSFAEGDRQRHRRLAWGGSALLFAISVPMVGIGVFAAPWMMELAFGSEYAEGGPVLQLLFVAAAVSFQVSYARNLLIAIDRQGAMIWLTLLGLVVRAGLVYLMIQWWGITGAAVAVLISESAMLVAAWVYLAVLRWRSAPVAPAADETGLLHRYRPSAN